MKMITHFTRLAILSASLFIYPLGSMSANAADELTVLLDWFVNPDHAQLIIAQEKGYFKEVDLDVTLIAPADPNDPPKLVAAKQFSLAISYQPQLHVLVSEDLPLTRIATLVATPLNSLVVLRDGPIKSIPDLKGRKIGYSVGGFEDALLDAMLGKYGLKIDDVELINVNFSLSPALISGQVDAVIGAFRNFELNQMQIVNAPGRAFYPEEEGVPSYDELIVIANSDNLDDPRFPRFVNALERASQFLINHPDEGWEIFIKAYPDLNDELNKMAWYDTLPRFSLRPGAMDEYRYNRFADFLLAKKLIMRKADVASYAIDIR